MLVQGLDIWTRPQDIEVDEDRLLEDTVEGVKIDGEEVRATIE